MGLHIQSISNAAYRGEVSFDIIRRIARRAKATPEELLEILHHWLVMRTIRPRENPLRRAVMLNDALTEEITRFEEWLEKRDELEAYLKWRKRRPVLRQLAAELREDG